MNKRWRLILAALAFVGWLSYLGYAALTKNRGPIISRIQAAGAKHAVVAEVKAGTDGKPISRVKVIESLLPDDPAAGSEIEIVNLSAATAFSAEGPYLLLLNPEPVWQGNSGNPQLKAFHIVGQQRSPGNDVSGVGPPLIYPWNDTIRSQFAGLPRPK